MQVIQRISVVGDMVFEVGGEYDDGRVIIEIKSKSLEFENSVHSEYHVLGEDNELIASIENCPVIVEYRNIAGGGLTDDPDQRRIPQCPE